MKTIIQTLLSFLLFAATISCSKEEEKDTIVGKWVIHSKFNGYLNGGDHKWQEVPGAFKYSFEFGANGQFSEIYPVGWTSCSGTYTIISNTEVRINSDCQSSSYILSVNVIDKLLTIKRQVLEGVIIEKFTRER